MDVKSGIVAYRTWKLEHLKKKLVKKFDIPTSILDTFMKGDLAVLSTDNLSILVNLPREDLQRLEILRLLKMDSSAPNSMVELFNYKIKIIETLLYVQKVQDEWGHGPWEIAKTVQELLLAPSKMEMPS